MSRAALNLVSCFKNLRSTFTLVMPRVYVLSADHKQLEKLLRNGNKIFLFQNFTHKIKHPRMLYEREKW